MSDKNSDQYKEILEELLGKIYEYESEGYRQDPRYYRRPYDDGYGRSGYQGPGNMFSSFLDGMKGWDSKQFLMGAVLGATLSYIMTDQEMRDKILKFGAKMYTNIAGGFEEFKEQMADLKAEMSSSEKPTEP